MSLPNYFFADLPQEAELSASMIAEACTSLRRNRQQYPMSRTTDSLVRTFAALAQSWLDPEFPMRQIALEMGPDKTPFGRSTLERGLNEFFSGINEETLRSLIRQDLSHTNRFDQMVSDDNEGRFNRASLAIGPGLLVHLTAGVIPNPTFVSIMLGFLTRSAQFVKCASGTSFFASLFAHSIYHREPKLASCLEVAVWKGGNAMLEKVLFNEADCVTATGSDETLALVQKQLPRQARFIGFGHRVSFGYIGREVMHGLQVQRLASRAADDVTAWNQLGCLSPQVIYVQHGGEAAPEKFGELLAEELNRRETSHPRGTVPAEVAAQITGRRSFYEVRAAHSPASTRCWFSTGSTAWSVIYEADPLFQASCGNRFIYVKGVDDLDAALLGAQSIRGQVSTVGISVAEEKKEIVATQLARWGVTRVCPLGSMQNPPISWRHDGRPSLGDLVQWTDWEIG